MEVMHLLFDDDTIQRQTLKQERKIGKKLARRIAAKNLIKQGQLSFDVIASCLNISIDEVKYIANHIDEIEAEEKKEEEEDILLVS